MEDSLKDSDFQRLLLLHQRQILTETLTANPYDLVPYLERAVVYSELGYPDLAAGDAYRALLLTDEVRNDSFKYHAQARESLEKYSAADVPHVLRHGSLGTSPIIASEPISPDQDKELAALASIRCLQILSISLLLCGCLESGHNFCQQGLNVMPGNKELQEVAGYIQTVAERRPRTSTDRLPDRGVVRREVYPWNDHEPNRLSAESLQILNDGLRQIAPKGAVRISQLPVFLEHASETDGYDIIPTCYQLGLFAKEDIGPGETVLEEYTLLTAHNRNKNAACDACGTELLPLHEQSRAVSCPQCHDAVFCDQFCYEKALSSYHTAVCNKNIGAVFAGPDPSEADDTLYLHLLARLFAMATHQNIHPLDVGTIKYLWGDFLPSTSNNIDISPNAEPPPVWTLPFSFKYNIDAPLRVLEKMDVDIFATFAQHDLWIINTVYGKLRGTASARKSPHDNRPEVAAVHPFWCLANHDCDPNVTWEWGRRGRMKLTARNTPVVGNTPGGIKADEEILNHYCDVFSLYSDGASGPRVA